MKIPIRRKRRIKSVSFQVCTTGKLQGLFLSNLVCEAVNISFITYKKFVEIAF